MLRCEDDQKAFLLDSADHESIYESFISPILNVARDVEKPTAFFLGAQPGSGKTRLREILSKQTDSVIINTDDLRWFHPEYNKLLENSITNTKGPYFVNPDATAWSIRLFDEAIQQRSNIIIDSTFGGNPSHTIDRLTTLYECGYQSEFHIIAVNPKVSKLGIFLRYENGITIGTPERMVSMQVHDKNFQRLPENLIKIGTACRDQIARVSIYSRGNNLSWSSIFETSHPCDFETSIQILTTEQQRSFTTDEAERFAITMEEVRQMILNRNESDSSFIEALK